MNVMLFMVVCQEGSKEANTGLETAQGLLKGSSHDRYVVQIPFRDLLLVYASAYSNNVTLTKGY